MKLWLRSAFSVFQKEFIQEYRTRFALNSALAFVIASLFVVFFTVKIDQVPPTSRSGLVWIIILFAALSSLSRSFVQETDRQTFDVLRLNVPASTTYVGKLIFNFLFTLLVAGLSVLGFIFLADLAVAHLGILMLAVGIGSLGMSAMSTLLAAIIAQADHRGAVFPVMTMPLLIPLLLLVTRLTKSALVDGRFDGILNELTALIAFCGVAISLAVILIDFIWED